MDYVHDEEIFFNLIISYCMLIFRDNSEYIKTATERFPTKIWFKYGNSHGLTHYLPNHGNQGSGQNMIAISAISMESHLNLRTHSSL